jgi:BirA family biotin operon repressor/biotin-[acetyl-CoA-carboxylase] ligase
MTISWQVDTHAKLPSTQDYARDLAADGAPEGSVIQALSQTTGRGRQGRTWVSPMGNLYMSVLLRPDCPADKAGQVSFVTAVAVSAAMDAVMEPGHAKTLKWPNDILIDGRKAAGILIESVMGQDGMVDALIVGIGVNILTPPEDAIGLSNLSGGRAVPIHPFRDRVLEELAQAYRQWKHQGFGPIRTRWLKQAQGLGGPVKTPQGEGLFKDLDMNGALVLTLPDGGEAAVTAGDIFFAEGVS